jgi:hypothetical protein
MIKIALMTTNAKNYINNDAPLQPLMINRPLMEFSFGGSGSTCPISIPTLKV